MFKNNLKKRWESEQQASPNDLILSENNVKNLQELQGYLACVVEGTFCHLSYCFQKNQARIKWRYFYSSIYNLFLDELLNKFETAHDEDKKEMIDQSVQLPQQQQQPSLPN
jgi:hypothetical protein